MRFLRNEPTTPQSLMSARLVTPKRAFNLLRQHMREVSGHPVRMLQLFSRPGVGERKALHSGGMGGLNSEWCVFDGQA